MTTTGPNSGGTFASDNSVGTVAWTNPSNAGSSNNVYAVASLLGEDTSEYLKVTNFGFSVPSETIDGIEVAVERKGQSSGAILDTSVRIVKGGTIGATDRSSATLWPTTDTVENYGSTSDKWGETWTAADINGAGFGFAISVTEQLGAGSKSASIDHITITVTSSAGGGSPATTSVRTISFGGVLANMANDKVATLPFLT